MLIASSAMHPPHLDADPFRHLKQDTPGWQLAVSTTTTTTRTEKQYKKSNLALKSKKKHQENVSIVSCWLPPSTTDRPAAARNIAQRRSIPRLNASACSCNSAAGRATGMQAAPPPPPSLHITAAVDFACPWCAVSIATVRLSLSTPALPHLRTAAPLALALACSLGAPARRQHHLSAAHALPLQALTPARHPLHAHI